MEFPPSVVAQAASASASASTRSLGRICFIRLAEIGNPPPRVEPSEDRALGGVVKFGKVAFVFMRRIAAAIVVTFLPAAARAADDLPRRAPGEAMDFEPALLPDVPSPRDPVATVPRLEAALDRAKKNATAGERLFRAGAIAKIDAENRALKVVRLLSDLTATRAEAAGTDLAAKRAKFDAGSIPREALEGAQAAHKAATTAATEAAATWQRAELDAAELNLSRHRKLLAAGIGSRTMVQRAQAQLAALKSKPTPALPQKAE